MKKLLAVLLALLMVFTLAGCSGDAATDAPAADEGGETVAEDIKVAVLIPFLGDNSYFDTVGNGVKEANKLEGITVDIFECDPDGAAEQANWMNWYDNVCEDGTYDLVISGNNSYEQFLYEACEKYPDQKFMNFDTSAIPEAGVPANCYCCTFALDDLGYVVGALSSALSQTGRVGVVVGMDNQAMNQFIGGWCQVLADNDTEYMIYYPGSFTDTALGKSGTEALIEKGCDVIWQVAGGLGNGVIEACSEDEAVWCVGVDQDQYAQFKDTNPDWANTIITSALKNSNKIIVGVCQMLLDGTFDAKLGTKEAWGIPMDGVGIVENDFYKENCPAEVVEKVSSILASVTAGEVDVVDTMDWSVEEYEANWAAVRDAKRVE